MAIVVDARGMDAQPSGISTYTLGLLEGLSRLGPPERVVVLARRPEELAARLDGTTRLEYVAADVAPWSPLSSQRIPALLRSHGCTVYHCPYLYAPRLPDDVALVLTVHDYAHERMRRVLHRAWKTRLGPVWNAWFRRQVRRADALVTVSEFSRRELLTAPGFPGERLHVIHNGLRAAGRVPAPAEVATRLGLRGRIVSYVGRHDPHKGLGALIRAFHLALPSLPQDVTLVIAGRQDPRYPEPRELVRDLGCGERVRLVGVLDDALRDGLLAASAVFVFPSRYEGFGFPPLEAMRLGTPVIAGSAEALRETLGEAAIYVDTNDTADLARAITAVVGDRALAERLSRSGRAQAATYSWELAAAAHLRVYRTALRTRHPAPIGAAGARRGASSA